MVRRYVVAMRIVTGTINGICPDFILKIMIVPRNTEMTTTLRTIRDFILKRSSVCIREKVEVKV